MNRTDARALSADLKARGVRSKTIPEPGGVWHVEVHHPSLEGAYRLKSYDDYLAFREELAGWERA